MLRNSLKINFHSINRVQSSSYANVITIMFDPNLITVKEHLGTYRIGNFKEWKFHYIILLLYQNRKL